MFFSYVSNFFKIILFPNALRFPEELLIPEPESLAVVPD